MSDMGKHLLKGNLLTKNQFCKRVGICKRTLNRMIANNQVHYVKVGPRVTDIKGRDRRMVRIPESEIYRFCEVFLRHE